MIRSGTTRFWDMYWHAEATARAVADAGVRATIGAPLFDSRRRSARGCARRRSSRSTTLAEVGPARSRPASAPHAIYTVSEESLRWIAELARRARDADPDPPLRDRAGGRATASPPTASARPPTSTELGLLGERTVLAHGVWLDHGGAGADRRARRHRRHQPGRQHEARGRRRLPLPGGARRPGVAVGLGTDGAGSNDSLDLLADLKLFALSQKHAAGDPTDARRRRGLAIARGAARRCSARHGARGRRARRLPAAPRLGPASSARRPRRRPRLRRRRRGRRHHRRRRPGADAGRRGDGRRGDRRGGRRAPGASPDSVRAVRTQARFPDVPQKAGHYESFYMKLVQPGGGQGRLDPPHRPQAPGRGARPAPIWFVLFDSSRRGAAGDQAPVRRRAAQPPTGHLHPGRGRELGPMAARRRVGDRRARGELGPRASPATRALQVPARRLALPSAAAEDQVPQPLPGRRLRRAARGGRRADRGERLAGDDRPQLGRRARRALGLARGHRLRGPRPRTYFDMPARRGSRSAAGRRPGSPPGCWCSTARRTGSAASAASAHRGRGAADRLQLRAAGQGRRRPRPGRGRRGQGLRRLGLRRPVGPRAQHRQLLGRRPRARRSNSTAAPPSASPLPAARAYEFGMRETDHGIPIQPYPDG